MMKIRLWLYETPNNSFKNIKQSNQKEYGSCKPCEQSWGLKPRVVTKTVKDCSQEWSKGLERGRLSLLGLFCKRV